MLVWFSPSRSQCSKLLNFVSVLAYIWKQNGKHANMWRWFLSISGINSKEPFILRRQKPSRFDKRMRRLNINLGVETLQDVAINKLIVLLLTPDRKKIIIKSANYLIPYRQWISPFMLLLVSCSEIDHN